MGAFQNWVTSQGGPDKVAVLLNVSSFSVRAWFNRRGTPTVKNVMKIVKLSRGKLTADSIIKSITPKN